MILTQSQEQILSLLGSSFLNLFLGGGGIQGKGQFQNSLWNCLMKKDPHLPPLTANLHHPLLILVTTGAQHTALQPFYIPASCSVVVTGIHRTAKINKVPSSHATQNPRARPELANSKKGTFLVSKNHNSFE